MRNYSLIFELLSKVLYIQMIISKENLKHEKVKQ